MTDDEYVIRLGCLVRLGRFHEAIRGEVISRLSTLKPRLRMTAYSLLSWAFGQLGSESNAETMLRRAYETAQQSNARDDECAEVRYFDALHKISQHDFAGSLALVKTFDSSDGYRAKALILEAWIAAAQGDLGQQLDRFSNALDIDEDGELWSQAAMLHGYSALVRELYQPLKIAQLADRARAFPWSKDMFVQKFYTYRNLGWASALAGQSLQAYEYYCVAFHVAQARPEHRMLIYADKAFLALAMDQHELMKIKLDSAVDLLDTVAWHDAGEARCALLLLVELHAGTGDASMAQRCWDMYSSIRIPINDASIGVAAMRRRSLERYAEGWLLRVLGRNAEAIEAFSEAHDNWKTIGYSWRAVLAATALGELTGDRQHFDFALSETAQNFPHAWFARSLQRYRDRLDHEALNGLSPTKRNIIRLLLEGKKNQEIADELSLSHNTVRARLNELYEKFTPAQRSKTALVCYLHSLGL